MRAEDVILEAIRTGEFAIDDDGQIWRRRDRRYVRAENRTGRGYLQIRKMVDGMRYHAAAHRVVYEYFRGRIPDGHIINHINGQKDDNRPWNLEISTHSENQRHAFKHGLHDQSGEKNPAAKLTDREVAEIRLAYATGGFTQQQLADKYGISFQSVSKIVRGERRAGQPGETSDYTFWRQRGVGRDPLTGRFIAKKAAGRLLDGREWNEFPKVGATP